jgi:arsenate reductase
MKYLSLIAILLSLTTCGQTQPNKVIFVCEHGAAKSVIAAAYFNKIAKERNLNWEAVSRGTSPDATIGQSTKEGLIADHLYDQTFIPKKLSVKDTSNAKAIIRFTALPGEFNNSNVRTENWSSLRDIDSGYTLRRDAIVEQINIFLDSLQKQIK